MILTSDTLSSSTLDKDRNLGDQNEFFLFEMGIYVIKWSYLLFIINSDENPFFK